MERSLHYLPEPNGSTAQKMVIAKKLKSGCDDSGYVLWLRFLTAVPSVDSARHGDKSPRGTLWEWIWICQWISVIKWRLANATFMVTPEYSASMTNLELGDISSSEASVEGNYLCYVTERFSVTEKTFRRPNDLTSHNGLEMTLYWIDGDPA